MESEKTGILDVIEWHSLVRDVIRNFWTVILAGIIAFLGLYVAEHSVYKPEYKSQATLVVRAKAASSLAYTNLTASSEMATIYTKVFTQPAMKKMAADDVGYDAFDGEISASVHEGTNLLNISVVSSDPEVAYNLLSAVLRVYPNISDAVFSNSVIDIVSAPEMPTNPINAMSSSRRVLISFAVAAVWFAVILVLSFFRDTVKNVKIFEKKIDAKLLGTVTHEKRPLPLWKRIMGKKKGMLVDTAFASLRFTEDYSRIATKLSYIKRNTGSKVFTVTSVTENEGKSTASANIAISLARRGYKVVLMDLDLHKPAMYKIFRYRRPLKTEFSDILRGEVSPREYDFLRYKKTNLFLALSKKNCPDASEWLGSEIVEQCFESLKQKVDFVIIDTPPTSVSADAMTIAKMSDKTILVVRTDIVDIADINDTILTISNIGAGFAGCILNDVYKPFTLFGNMGADDRGYSMYKSSAYRKYNGYASADKYRKLMDEDLLSVDNGKQ
ncbi:MAG: polysaccharide biosynthesis tyrosine autokinase [Clostridia bacterium]|nr:polysaccharide biosynthesis tyrosine autokinase [Clostridia bacterium]